VISVSAITLFINLSFKKFISITFTNFYTIVIVLVDSVWSLVDIGSVQRYGMYITIPERSYSDSDCFQSLFGIRTKRGLCGNK